MQDFESLRMKYDRLVLMEIATGSTSRTEAAVRFIHNTSDNFRNENAVLVVYYYT